MKNSQDKNLIQLFHKAVDQGLSGPVYFRDYRRRSRIRHGPGAKSDGVAVTDMRIPTEAGRACRFDAGHVSELMAATIPI